MICDLHRSTQFISVTQFCPLGIPYSGAGEIRERWLYRQAFQCGILQKWSTSWGAYIDVESVDDIKDKDRLTVVPQGTYVGSPKVRT